MATTPRWALRYPVGSDAPDVPLWMNRLATDLDAVAMDDQGRLADRPVSSGASPGKRGRYYYTTDTRQLFRDNGSGWDEMAIGAGVAAGDYKHSLQTASHGARADGLFAWLLADGTETPSGYTALLSVLSGNPFGVGAGGRPLLPDLRGRVPVMPDGEAGRMASNDALGNAGGEERHTLSVSEIPAHSHTLTDRVTGYGGVTVGNDQSAFFTDGANHTPSGVASVANTGGGASHNNMQPYLVTGSWFIKT